jgi:hypothetical protein
VWLVRNLSDDDDACKCQIWSFNTCRAQIYSVRFGKYSNRFLRITEGSVRCPLVTCSGAPTTDYRYECVANKIEVKTGQYLKLIEGDSFLRFEFCDSNESMNFKLPTPNPLLLDRSPNIGPLISLLELDKFENCWNKSFRTSKL